MRTYVAAKLHNLIVTDSSVDYIGSVTVAADVLAAAAIDPYERCDVVNLNTGDRWTTYVLPGPAGVFTLNGGGARLGVVGDRCVLMTYRDADSFPGALAVFVDSDNSIERVLTYPLPAPVVQP